MGPVIGCGGLFISRCFMVLHQGGVVVPAFLGGKKEQQNGEQLMKINQMENKFSSQEK